jgi:predicted HicB family RNase H-like nuclease
MGTAAYDAEDGVYGGRVLGIEDIVHFEGSTPEEVAEAFRGSVDDYLEHCRGRGKEPNKPFSGKFSLRMPAQMHRQLSVLAEARQTSLNALVLSAIKAFARE